MEFLAKVENRGAYKDLIDFNKNLYGEIIEKLKTVEDPEISMDVYNLGLIYNILGDLNNNIIVVMTLTTPACPMASMLIKNIVSEVEKVPEVNNVVEISNPVNIGTKTVAPNIANKCCNPKRICFPLDI